MFCNVLLAIKNSFDSLYLHDKVVLPMNKSVRFMHLEGTLCFVMCLSL
jgi:hypothetical protein